MPPLPHQRGNPAPASESRGLSTPQLRSPILAQFVSHPTGSLHHAAALQGRGLQLGDRRLGAAGLSNG